MIIRSQFYLFVLVIDPYRCRSGGFGKKTFRIETPWN